MWECWKLLQLLDRMSFRARELNGREVDVRHSLRVRQLPRLARLLREVAVTAQKRLPRALESLVLRHAAQLLRV